MKDYDQVYEPHDDTFLLIDGLKLALKEEEIVKERIHTTLELGCGTGVPTVFLAKQLLDECVHIVTDVNLRTLDVAQATAAANGIRSLQEAVECDLGSALCRVASMEWISCYLILRMYQLRTRRFVGRGSKPAGLEDSTVVWLWIEPFHK
ncbi:MAG: methyltransferase [Desulfobacterales bacterium]|nr:methyltransferase [Desulfobacterales bacterium]